MFEDQEIGDGGGAQVRVDSEVLRGSTWEGKVNFIASQLIQNEVRGKFLRWFPPYCSKALLRAELVRFAIHPGISSDMFV